MVSPVASISLPIGSDVHHFVFTVQVSIHNVGCQIWHSTSEYHVMSLTRMEEFINRYRYHSEAVNTKLHKESQAIVEANQKVVESVVMVRGK